MRFTYELKTKIKNIKKEIEPILELKTLKQSILRANNFNLDNEKNEKKGFRLYKGLPFIALLMSMF